MVSLDGADVVRDVSTTPVEISGLRRTPEDERNAITDWESEPYRQKSRAITNL